MTEIKLLCASFSMVLRAWYQSLLFSALWYNPSGPEVPILILKIAECDDRIREWTNPTS